MFRDSPLFPPVSKEPPEHLSETSCLRQVVMKFGHLDVKKKKKKLKSKFVKVVSLREASIFCMKVAWKVVFCIRLKHVSDAVTHLKVEFLTLIMQKWERFESRRALRFTGPTQQEVTQHHLLLWRAELEGDPLLMTARGGSSNIRTSAAASTTPCSSSLLWYRFVPHL